MTREEKIRATCDAHGLAGLAEICIPGGVSAETTERLALYLGAMLDLSARRLAAFAADLVAAELAGDRLERVATECSKTDH